MTAQVLIVELTAILQESKRKNQELRNAAEKSLSELKALPQTSETQLTADLKNRPTLIRPLFIACSTRNAKLAGSGVNCLQRLIIIKALPRDSLKDVVEAFRDCSSHAADIQLKVLQALPSLLQNYGGSLTGQLLATAFEVCFLLYGSKTAVVSNTAAAALQQLVTATFEKASSDSQSAPSDGCSYEVPSDDGNVSVHGAAADAYHVLNDLCLMTEGQRPRFLTVGSLTQKFGLELLESILVNYADTVTAHPEQIHILRRQLVPLMLKMLSEKVSFGLTVRVMRLLQLLVSEMLFALAAECEEALRSLNTMLDPATTLWKRVLALEVFRNIHANPTLFRSIYEHFDEKPDGTNIIGDHFGSLVRLAAEKPTVIGLGLQLSSSITPQGDSDEASGMATANTMGTEGVGLSSRWSMLRIPCIEMIDKAEPPNIPSTYLYALTLNCINNFPDGLARFLLPLTAPSEARTKRRQRTTQDDRGVANQTHEENGLRSNAEEETKPSFRRRSSRSRKESVNPLSLEDHVLYRQIRTSADMVDKCWPALLAAYSTFLSATLDTEYYHALIRSFQKFTQVAGLLDFSTPRDAFLTTLGKYAIPSGKGVNSRELTSFDHGFRRKTADGSDQNFVTPGIVASPTPKTSSELGHPAMTARNLLCLRALLNLGIALGPSLHQSWSIILETFQQAELLLPQKSASGQRPQPPRQPSRAQIDTSNLDKLAQGEDLGIEIAAAQTAATRLIESTSEYPDDAFMTFTQCLCSLLHHASPEHHQPVTDFPSNMLSPQTPSRKHQRFPSVAEWAPEGHAQQGNIFVLEKLQDLIQYNVDRLAATQNGNAAFDVLTGELKAILGTREGNTTVRHRAVETLSGLLVTVAIFIGSEPEEQDATRARAFRVIREAVAIMHKTDDADRKEWQICDEEIHRLLLEATRSILEQCGDSIISAWDTVFSILGTAFDNSLPESAAREIKLSNSRSSSPKLVRSSFGSLQLICSDYLQFVPLVCLPMLIDTLYFFCSQNLDFNISLTTSTFFGNVSSFLQQQENTLSFDKTLVTCSSEADLVQYTKRTADPLPTSALWLLLIVRMKNVLIDDRSEVRHSVLHTLFRILRDRSDELSGSTWRICFDLVLCQMLRANQEKYKSIPASAVDEWDKTASIMTNGMASILAQNLETIGGAFCNMWTDWTQSLRPFLARNVPFLSSAVFAGLMEILEEVDSTEIIGRSSINDAWNLWQNFNPLSSSLDASAESQDATMSYLRCIAQIYRLMDADTRNKHAASVLKELHICVIRAELPAYTKDIDRMTPVQKGVMENIKIIPTNQHSVRAQLTEFIASLITLPYQRDDRNGSKDSTFLAVSKVAITYMQAHTTKHATETTLASCALLTRALHALAVPIHLKYTWQGKEQSPWREATKAAVQILQACMPAMTSLREPEQEVSAFWEAVIRIYDGVVTADCDSCTDAKDIPRDEDFDRDAVSKIQELITPALGSSQIPEATRHHYTKTLFEKSLIHEPHPDDLPLPGQALLEGLKHNHIGRTQDLPPTARSRMSYVLLDSLFDLVAVHDGSAERVRLAQTAAPYLLLRCGMVLKSYADDQPLRGLMPQPWTQKRELRYILQKMGELDLESEAIGDTPSMIESKNKNHLFKLYPLLIKASKAAFGDQEVMGAFNDVLEKVGLAFSV